jgi:hypothetical protein
MNSITRLAGAAIAIVVIAGAVYLVQPRLGPGGPPTPTPTPTTSPSAAPTVTRPTPDPAACALATSEEVNAAVPGSTGLGALPNAGDTGGFPSCAWLTGGGDVLVRVTLTATGGAVAFTEAQSIAGVETITGVGDDAVFDAVGGALYVVVGDAMVTIEPGFLVSTPTQQRSSALNLAEVVIPRL